MIEGHGMAVLDYDDVLSVLPLALVSMTYVVHPFVPCKAFFFHKTYEGSSSLTVPRWTPLSLTLLAWLWRIQTCVDLEDTIQYTSWTFIARVTG